MIILSIAGKLADLDHHHGVREFTIERVVLSWDELHKRLIRTTTDVGRDIGIQLDSGHLHPGDILLREEHHLIVVDVKEESVLIIPVGNMKEMGLAAHAVGNMHAPIQIQQDCVITPFNSVLQDQLRKLGLAPVKEDKAFVP